MDNAIILASGMGTRMRPLTDFIPKPLIKIGEKPMIETLIDSLELRGVTDIIVVVGYLGDQFEYLMKKYSNITIVNNVVYDKVNNISSLYAAREYLLKGSCFICEADLFICEKTIFMKELNCSCYFGKYILGHSDDWVFDQNEEGIITRVGKSGDNCYNMVGISYFTGKDAKVLYKMLEMEYSTLGYEKLFWDDVVNKHINSFSLVIHPVEDYQIVEIDTVDELNEVRKSIVKMER